MICPGSPAQVFPRSRCLSSSALEAGECPDEDRQDPESHVNVTVVSPRLPADAACTACLIHHPATCTCVPTGYRSSPLLVRSG